MMSLETGSTAPSSETVSETVSSESSAVESNDSGSGYAKTDPGYDAFDDSDDDATENTETPSETSDDASDSNATEEKVETPAVDEAAEPETISDELLDKAYELGYTVEELKKFNDVKSLEKEITLTARLQERWQKSQDEKSLVADKPPEPEIAPADEDEPKWDELIEQGHDPDMVALLKRNSDRAARAEAQVKQLSQIEAKRAFDAQCDRFDDALNKIGDEFKDVFGTGTQDELADKSPEQAKNRVNVFQKMNMLRHGYLTAGQRVPPEADLIQEAVHASFYKHAQTTARKRLTGDIKKAGSQALSRPNSGGAQPLNGPQKALQIEQEYWKQNSL